MPDLPRPGVLLLTWAIILVLANMTLGFLVSQKRNGNISAGLGGAVAQFVMPVVIALLFSLSPGFRNPRARTQVVFWSSLALLALNLMGSFK